MALNIENSPKLPWYKEINSTQKSALVAGVMGWGLDAFDTMIYSFTILSLMKEWGLTSAQTGMVASFALIAGALGGIIFGVVADKIGRIKALTISILIFSVFSGLTALTQNIWQMLIARLLIGLGLGGEWAAGATLISETWPAKHRGKALAIMQSGYSIGAIVATLISGPIIAHFGWRVLYVIGVLPALLTFYIRKNVKEPEIWKERGKIIEDEKKISVFSMFKPGMLGKTILGLLFVTFILAASLPITIYQPVFLGLPVAKGGAGVSTALSSILVFPTYFGSFFGYLSFGFISDKFGRKKTFIVYLIITIISAPLMFYAATINFSLYIVLALIFGFFGPGLYAGLGPILAEIFPTSIRATGSGFCYNGGRLVAAAAITYVGVLAGIYSMKTVLITLPAVYVGSLILIFFFKETVGKQLD